MIRLRHEEDDQAKLELSVSLTTLPVYLHLTCTPDQMMTERPNTS